MYVTNITSLYKILKKEPKTVDEVKDHKKGIKELKKLIDRYVKRHRNSNEMKKIKVIFSKYNKPGALIGEVFGFRVNKSPICDENVKKGIETLFDIFKNKGSKKFSQAIKDKLVGLTLSEEDVKKIFEAFDALFGVLSFSRSDMLKLIDVISGLVDQERDNLMIVFKRIAENFNNKCETLYRLYSREVVQPHSSKISHELDELSKATVVKSFVRKVEALWKDANIHQSINEIPPNDELLKRLYGSANDLFERIHFQTMTNTFCCAFNISLKEPFDIKIKKIYDKCKNAVERDIKNCEQQINKMVDEMEKTLLKKSGKKPEPTKPLPIPPVRGKSLSDVPEKSLSTSQKNSGRKNIGSRRGSIGRLSLEQMKTLEESLNNKSKPLSKPSSEQRKDAIYSSEDESKNPSTSNDESKNQKKRFSKLFGIKRKEDNKQDNRSNKSWRKSLKNRLSKSFGKSSKPSNDTFTSSSNSTGEISTES